MRKNFTMCLLLIFVFIFSKGIAQEVQHGEKRENTISNQFDEVISKSNSYQHFKVIDRSKLMLLQKNISDTLKGFKNEMLEKKETIENQKKQIEQLNVKITDLEKSLETTNNEKDSFNFFGVLISKGLYSIIMWSIVLFLTFLLVFYILRYSKGKVITQKSLKDLEELQAEYESYRASAIDREQKVRRQLQNEINKNKELR
ncbi:hypothetical protein [Capnocytophaga canimorsus]|uniref:hypothetical protein n=1 Tax=Capnocytophaga canimorsus TaxID=28188 RepID=UPI001BB41F8A|nr:hypothetical protein [Capnocytophaga canimorsus]